MWCRGFPYCVWISFVHIVLAYDTRKEGSDESETLVLVLLVSW